jgi:hypothetical protein
MSQVAAGPDKSTDLKKWQNATNTARRLFDED